MLQSQLVIEMTFFNLKYDKTLRGGKVLGFPKM